MSEFIKQKQVEGLIAALAAKALDADVVKIANDLSDVDATRARQNLSVYSKAEVESLVAGAEDAYSVATLTERNALTALNVSDRVFVKNDGDGKWALYIVTATTDGKGSTSTFTKVADEDLFTNALSKEAVKSAYESNADTNAFTDAQQTKVDLISVTSAVDLDATVDTLSTTTETAETALSTAGNATALANAAQNAADSAAADAAAAQSTADKGVADAATAQAAADAAQAAAEARELAFTERVEQFAGKPTAANTPFSMTLTKSIAAGFVPLVFINGMRAASVTFTAGSSAVSVSVPYELDAADAITVHYAHR